MAKPQRRGGAWLRTGRLNGSDAGREAKQVWVCSGCEVHNYKGWDKYTNSFQKPAACIKCGRMDFLFFHSQGEANYWARLRQMERGGYIRALRRQVPLALFTVGREGLPVKWAELIVDYAYVDDEGAEHLVDWKPVAGLSLDAALKIRCLEAQGTIVEIVNSKGTV